MEYYETPYERIEMTTIINMTPEELDALNKKLNKRLAIRVAVVVTAVVVVNYLDHKLNK